MKRPIGVDLFAGAGGMSLGFEQAGFDVVAAVELDPIHAAVHKFNFPRCATLPRSVQGLTGRAIRQAAGIGNRSVDVVFGGAPCQGFSLIGHRVLEDPRNSLVREFLRIVRELDASYFVFENVKGLTVGAHRQILDELIEAFDRAGYEVRDPWQVLNASHFGVPQDRQRLFLLGAKKGRRLPTYPAATTSKAGAPRLKGDLPYGPTCAEALADLPNPETCADLWSGDSIKAKDWGKPSAYARAMRCLSNDAWAYGYPRVWDRSLLTSSMLTEHTPISRRRFASTTPGEVEPISRFFKLPPDGVANTLRAGTDTARGAFTSPRPIHYEANRCVTVREMARLHSFPDWFRFHETKWHGAREIGNSVPPLLARAVATQVILALGARRVRPSEAIPLGDPALLRMGMNEAAAFWSVPVPIAKRDRKSGARKRTQVQIEMQLKSERRRRPGMSKAA